MSLSGRLRLVAGWLFWSLVFGIAYTQAPLYYSNQNQYFVHGLARAGLGNLDQDWLANTHDPTPVFSTLVEWTYFLGSERWFYLYYLLLLGIYFHSLMGLATAVLPTPPSPSQRLVLATLLVAFHAGLVRLASARLSGVDYPWYFQAGVAGQYLLGFGLQPSVFGLFLIVSLNSFVQGHSRRASLWLALAAMLHSTYLLPGAFITLAYMFSLGRNGKPWHGFLLGTWTLLLVVPVVIYDLEMFRPTSMSDAASSILAHFRIPHHAEPGRWFDLIALAQVVWMVAAMVLVLRHRIFPLLFLPFLLGILLSLLQLATKWDQLALLFPWRISVVLVPVATALILARLVEGIGPWLARLDNARLRVLQGTMGICLGVLVLGGLAIPYWELGFRTNADELPLLEYVRRNSNRDEVYLLPVQVPKVGTGPRGAYSTNFLPPPRGGGHLIAVDLQRFRLVTGAPIYVDFKSIPYQDGEVLEWYDRLQWVRKIYAHPDWHDEQLAELMDRGITHVVASSGQIVQHPALEKVFANTNYCLYRVPPLSPGK